LRPGGAGYNAHCHADINADTDSDADTHTDTDSDADTHTNHNPDTDAHTDADRNADANTDQQHSGQDTLHHRRPGAGHEGRDEHLDHGNGRDDPLRR